MKLDYELGFKNANSLSKKHEYLVVSSQATGIRMDPSENQSNSQLAKTKGC